MVPPQALYAVCSVHVNMYQLSPKINATSPKHVLTRLYHFGSRCSWNFALFFAGNGQKKIGHLASRRDFGGVVRVKVLELGLHHPINSERNNKLLLDVSSNILEDRVAFLMQCACYFVDRPIRERCSPTSRPKSRHPCSRGSDMQLVHIFKRSCTVT